MRDARRADGVPVPPPVPGGPAAVPAQKPSRGKALSENLKQANVLLKEADDIDANPATRAIGFVLTALVAEVSRLRVEVTRVAQALENRP